MYELTSLLAGTYETSYYGHRCIQIKYKTLTDFSIMKTPNIPAHHRLPDPQI